MIKSSTQDELTSMTEGDLENALFHLASQEEPDSRGYWFGKPERWWDSSTWRCLNDHVTKIRQTVGCTICGAKTLLTCPEDVSGPVPREHPLRRPDLTTREWGTTS